MGVYGGIQLPKISENTLDDRKERKQILNYLALLDEKLRYMFQNIDIEENLSADSQKMFFKYGEDIKNVIKDTEGRFSLFEQTINGISMAVQDNEGNISLLQQTATSLSSSIASAEGKISTLEQTAERIETSVYDLEGNVSTVTQTANSLKSTVSSLQDDVDDAYTMAEQAEDHFSWIVESGTSASKMTLTDEFLEIITDNIEIRADVDLYGEMTVWTDRYMDQEGGYFGFMYGDDPLNGSTKGIGMTDYSESGGVICHGSGSAIWYDDYGITIDSSDINFIGDYDFYLATNFYCGTDGVSALGKSNRTWAMLYADACSCCTSDERRKNSIGYDLTAYEGLFERLKPTQFKMNNGTSDRFHVGFVSQDVEKALEETGLDSLDFAGFIKSPVYEEDEKGKEIEGGEIVDYRYGLRYEEFVALNTHMIQKLMTRVTELENKLEALS